jgi:hypothetical protein
MWIRNKGTADNPRFALVESRYTHGKFPRQKVVCYLGRHDNFEDAIRFWEIVLRSIEKVERKNPMWWQRPKEHPAIAEYAERWGSMEISARLKKLRKCAARFRHHQKMKDIDGIKRNAVHTKNTTPKSLKLKLQILALSKSINKIKRTGENRRWSAEIKSALKSHLKDVVDFYEQL